MFMNHAADDDDMIWCFTYEDECVKIFKEEIYLCVRERINFFIIIIITSQFMMKLRMRWNVLRWWCFLQLID
jgi:hypothetical protein